MLKVFFIIGVIAKRHIVVIALAIFIIYVSSCFIVKTEPCVIETVPIFIGEGMSKLSDGSIKNGEFGFQKSDNIVWPFDWVGINIRKLTVEGGKKSLIRLSSIIDGGKLDGEPITNPHTQKSTDSGKASGDKCYFIGSKIQFWAALLLGHLVGLIVAIIIILFVFTQHIIHLAGRFKLFALK